jgi:pimeloyl-ACP methyl ester carboxylesterase
LPEVTVTAYDINSTSKVEDAVMRQIAIHTIALAIAAIAAFAVPLHAAVKLETAAKFDPVAAAPIRIAGAEPNETLSIIATRSMEVWRPDKDGNWKPQPTRFTSWAEVTADSAGVVDLAKATPLFSSYNKADPLGLLWSGYPDGSAEIPESYRNFAASDDGSLRLVLLRGGQEIAKASLALTSDDSNIRIAKVQQPGMVGVFAAPKGGSKLPTVIVMHGSEGSNLQKARNSALTYAQQGFATFALAWYTQPYEPEQYVPSSAHLVDVNQLERVRDWLTMQPEADIKRLGLWGVSKGGEFAMVGASRFPWVKATVGCVPSDIVWQGFGEGDNVPPFRSTWQVDGKALPFVPLYPQVDGRYRDNTDRYERSRRFNADAAIAARIPIEKTKAKLLLIGGDRDEVWASGAMARNMAESMRRVGKGKQVETVLIPEGGHSLCGDGSFPVRAYGKDDPNPDRKRLNAEGHGNVEAFRATISFLKKAL